MRIAFITESFPERSETFILGKVVELAARGHQVTVFSQAVQDSAPHPDLLARVDVSRVIKLPAWDRVRGRDVSRAVKAAGASPARIARAWKGTAQGAGDGAGRALRLIKSLPFTRDAFDVVHAHYGYMAARYGGAARVIGAPLIVSLLGHDVTYAGAEHKESYQGLFTMAARFLASSRYLADQAVRLGFPADKITIHYPEVDAQFFSFVDRGARGQGTCAIVSVCRLDWTKGLGDALKAVRALLDKGVTISYRIVGGGKMRGEVEQTIKDLRLDGHVVLAGAKDREGCREELARADLFLMPSVSESFGLAAAEAQATGLPVVATNVGGLPEAVKDKETGFLVPPHSPEALVERVRYLMEHREERLAMGRRAREWAAANFNQDMLTDRLIRVYEEVVREKKAQ
ncbi:MAG TPA: glycosyltransferase [bacterium]|nr:glycosyltransferase [bacterium]